MTEQANRTTGWTQRKIAARDGEEIAFRENDEDWRVAWHPPPRLPTARGTGRWVSA